jgi:hypothetical protein
MAEATSSLSQAFFTENSPAFLELEGMVDRVGIRNVLYALAKICDGKAEHVASMWQAIANGGVGQTTTSNSTESQNG